MSSTDCTDICNIVIKLMCEHCPNFKECQNIDGGANHDQMEECLTIGTMTNPNDVSDGGKWTEKFTPLKKE